MPIVIAAVGILATVYFYYLRANGAARAASDLVGAASEIRSAARRFGFRRRANTHPVDCIDDPNAVMAGIGAAFVEMGAVTSDRHWSNLTQAIRHELLLVPSEAQEMVIFGRWLVGKCGTPQAAVSRLARKLFKLRGPRRARPLLTIINNTLIADSAELSDRQTDALHDVQGRAANPLSRSPDRSLGLQHLANISQMTGDRSGGCHLG